MFLMQEEDKKVETSEQMKSNKSSLGYFAGVVILLLAVGAGAYFLNKSSESQKTPEETGEIATQKPSSPPSLKGKKLSDTQFANSAVLIYPGTISESAKAVMSGWDLKTTANSDGTITASLVPTGSEVTEGDTRHTFTLKSEDKLYFADLNPGDDGTGADNNKNDDMGIVVDVNGIIQ